MKHPIVQTSVHIRRKDEKIYNKLSQFVFSEFVSDMMNQHGPEYFAAKVKAEVEKLEKLTS